MTLLIKPQTGNGPNDLVAVAISDRRQWKFGPVRIMVDAAFVLAGLLQGGTFGAGTLICAAVVGPTAQRLMPFSERICRKILAEQG